jgi:hypothetical protein
VQIGSEMDRAIWRGWREKRETAQRIARMAGRLGLSIAKVSAAYKRAAEVLQRTNLSVLDLSESAGVEDRTPVSWEVERHCFLTRHMGGLS